MVFESFVVDLVNRYLGDFIENLDSSQLKIGIWGGDVVLKNLYVKESALDDLDLPIKVRHGNLGKLTLKIPWKNLYTEPTVATLEGLYVVAVPNADIAYNAEKEKTAEFEAKQKELARIEEAKKQEANKGKVVDAKQDGFGEKLATNVIKNLQVHISDIHIRYEDSFTNPSKPFSIGATLKNLKFQTTDSEWRPTVIKDAVTMIYKMVELNSLAVYWNCRSPSYLGLDRDEMLKRLQGNIIHAGGNTGYTYLVEPISSSAQLRIHTHPEKDNFSLAKLLLGLVFEQIAIGLSKHQYQDIMELLEALERMNLATKFRKYRPAVVRKGHSKQWWHFAYNCILEETVRRRRRMWSWQHILRHRDLCRKYKAAYKKKITSKKLSKDIQETLDNCERELNVFNLTLVRQQAEMEAKKEGLKKAKDGGGGWFGGWFGGKKAEEKKADASVGEQFEKLMTPEEKAKLYSAIGYSENAVDPTLPIEYVAHEVHFELRNLSLTLTDTSQVLNLQLKQLRSDLGQRPSANGLDLGASVESFTVLGMPAAAGLPPPTLVASQCLIQDQTYKLLDLNLALNPLDGGCDTRVGLSARPLEIIYNAATINQLVEFFKPPESVHLKQLQNMALEQFETLKDQTVTGLQHAIDERKYTEINVDIMPTHVIIPEKGVYKSDSRCLVLDLGELSISTQKQTKSAPKVELISFFNVQLTIDDVMDQAYDKFRICQKSAQLLFVNPGEDWKAARDRGSSHMHILAPLDFIINLEKCMIQDSRFPKMRVNGELPSINMGMSDMRLNEVLMLAQSIPLPQSAPPPPTDMIELDAPDLRVLSNEGNAERLLRDMQGSESGYSSPSSSDDESSAAAKPPAARAPAGEPAPSNTTDIELKFEIKEICVSIAQRIQNDDIPLLKLVVDSLGTEVKVRTFDISVSAYLGGIYLQHTQFKALEEGPLVNLVNTPITDDSQYKLLHVQLLMANPKGPDFATTYNNTVQKIDAHFTALEILLHQEAIVNLLDFAKTLKPAEAEPAAVEASVVPTSATVVSTSPAGDKLGGEARTARSRKKEVSKELIDLQLNANLDVFSVSMCTQAHPISDIKIKGLTASVMMQKSKIDVQAGLKNLAIYDPTPHAIYPQILMFKGDEVFSSHIVVYNGATEGDNYSLMDCVDTSVELQTGCMQVVFLNKFILTLQRFADALLSQTAKDKLAEASTAAAETATKAAQDLAAKSPRVKLNIKLKAPVIVVPQKSTSENAILVDLGYLEVKNEFKIAAAKNSQGVPAVLDNMGVKLTALKLSRALMMGADVVAECSLLEPLTLQVDISRNLAASWYHGHPDVTISGKLHQFSVGMSQGDFTCIMSLLNENLQEGVTPAETPALPEVGNPQPGEQPVVATSSTTLQAAPPTKHLAPEDSSHSKLKFSFSIQSICAQLYNGDSNLASGFSNRDPKQSLAKFELQKIEMSGNMHPDGAMEASVSLSRCILHDSRPGQEEGITRMVDTSSQVAAISDTLNMIDVTFAQSANQNKDLELSVNGLYICVCTEYLMTLADFFVKGLPQQPAAPPSTVASPPTGPASAATTSEAVAKAPVTPPPGEITIVVRVDKPEIVLVEDAMNIFTNALILDVEVYLKLRMSPEIQTMMGTIKGLQIVSCSYADEMRESSKALILQPTEIHLHSNAPQGKGHHMDVMVTDIVMNISPATIRTLVATFSSLAVKPESGEENSLQKIPQDLWTCKKLADCEFWFLKQVSDNEEELAAARRALEEEDEVVDTGRGEQLMVKVSRIVIKLEGGVGKRTVPFIITEMGFKGEVCNWSSKLYVDAELFMEVAYYNERMATWEPILEPVEENGVHRPWEIRAVIQNNDMFALDDLDADDDKPIIPAPKMTISIISTDILETTITKSCLEVLSNLGKSFGDAYMLVEVAERPGEVHPPYTIKNDSGIYVKVKVDDSFKEPERAVEGHSELETGDSLQVFNADQDDDRKLGRKKSKSILATNPNDNNKTMYIVMEDFGATRELKVVKAEKRAFNINMRAYPKDVWQMVSQVEASYGCKTITLRSILQVVNHMPFSMELYYKLSDEAMGRCGLVLPGKSFNVPCDAVYSAPYQLYVKPHDPRYQESKTPIEWKNLADKNIHISCAGTKPDISSVFCTGRVETEKILLESSGQMSATLYTLHINPSVMLRNLLPMPVSYILSGMEEYQAVEGGEKVELLNADIKNSVIEIKIMNYLDKEWTGRLQLQEKPQQLAMCTFDAATKDANSKVSIDLGVHTSTLHGYQEIELYCPYWMINKTGRQLTYKAGDDFSVAHPSDVSGVVLFSFRSKSFFGKKKDDKQNGAEAFDDDAQPASKCSSLSRKTSAAKKKSKSKTTLKKTVKASLRVSESEWSDKFSLDTVGSAGTVACKFKGYNLENKEFTHKLQVGVKISLTSSGLTKICTFTPYFMINNKATFTISCKETAETGMWYDVSPGQCVPFWPTQTGKNLTMLAKINSTDLKTNPFYFTEPHTTLLQLNHEYGGINVQTHISESAVNVELEQYKPGFATVLLVNQTANAVISYNQRDVRDGQSSLGPQDIILYTWQDPTGKRELVWDAGEKKNQRDDLVKDGIGDFFYNSDTKMYWVSFLDGMQRVLLFTEDIAVATAAQQAGELERVDQEINFSLQGLGLSLVNNHIQKEVAYMGIRCSGVIWEEKKKKRFKALKNKQSLAIEEAYERWTNQVQLGKNTGTRVNVAPKLDVDFGEYPMMFVKTSKTPIRRSFEYGLWMQYRQSAHQMQVHLKIHRLQLDNQLPGAVFPTVLAPIPPPKSVAAESVPKPFTELSLMIRKREFTQVMQFKYAKVLIQEMAVKVDQGFINSMIELFAPAAVDEGAQVEAFKQDCSLISVDLAADADQASADENRHFYDILHFSPLKVHLSFSLYGSAGDEENKKPTQLKSNVLNLFLQSVGIVLTDIQDVVFKLGYFERNYMFYTQSQLQGQITRHYSSQAIKQMYVLVLGLDVLGNPFGVIRGMAQGIEDFFYEPYQGAIQGPEEFAEGLALGVRSLLGHAVGGAAGAVSRITGALGKGIATLTLDDDYQRKRREQLNKRPADLKEGLARGGKGLVMGVVDGVTGIVRRPIEGAKQEGVEGFFKGVGKGLVGVFTRPASGVVDFASSSFEGIRRVAEMSDEVHRQRPPRFIHKDGIIHPYSFQAAQGNDILQDVEKGRFAASDQYEAFLYVTTDAKHAVLVTTKRVMFVSKGEVFGHWDFDWGYTWEELKEPPMAVTGGIQILLKEKQKKSFFSSGTVGKKVALPDPKACEWLVTKMKTAMSADHK